jgi:hypothetical protein
MIFRVAKQLLNICISGHLRASPLISEHLQASSQLSSMVPPFSRYPLIVLSASSQATFFLAIFTIKQPFLFLADGMITESHDWTIINTNLKAKSLAIYMASENKNYNPMPHMPSAYPKWNLREFKQDPCAKIGHFHLLQP